MTTRRNTLSQSYIKLVNSKSMSCKNIEKYKQVVDHVKLIYRKDMTVANNTTESVISEHPRFIFKPDSIIRLSWDIYMLFVMIYLAISIPFYISFYIPITGPLKIIEFTVQISLMLDIIVTANTSYFLKGAPVVSRKKILLKYIKGWFWPDILSSFPYNWLYSSPFQDEVLYEYDQDFFKISQIIKLIRILRVIRALKLIKLTKVKKILTSIEDALVNHKVAMMFIFLKLIMVMILVAHWIACVWHLSAVESAAVEPTTWLKVFLSISQKEVGTAEVYVSALYWAFTTMVSVGYGDIKPYSTTEMGIGIFTMACSSTIFAYIIGTFNSLITSATAKETSHREIIIAVNRYMKKAQLPVDLQYRVRRYLDYIFQSQNKSDLAEENIMQMLSLKLKDEIYTLLHGDIIKSCRFFTKREDEGGLSREILSQVHRILKFEAFAPTDTIFKQGETSRFLYFVLSGKVDLYHHNTDYSYVTLQSGTCFGEIAFFTGKPRTTSAKCLAFTEFFSMGFEDLLMLTNQNIKDQQILEAIKVSCEYDDYSILMINCYMCGTLGHIANNCKMILFNLDKEAQKNSKIAEDRKSKQIKVGKEERKSMVNRRKNIRAGIKHFRNRDTISNKINNFSLFKDESLKIKENARDAGPKRYSFIYNITESSHEEEDERMQEPMFIMKDNSDDDND